MSTLIQSRHRPAASVCVLLVASVWFNAAWADSKSQDAAIQQVLRKAQGVVRQLTQDKAALEAEKAAWLTEKSGLEAKLKSLEDSVRQLQPLQGEVERYKSSLQSVRTDLESQVGQARAREQTLLRKHREVIDKAKQIREDNVLLVQAVQEREQWIAQCGQRNGELVSVNRDVVQKYRDKGLWETVTGLEPFTGIGDVEAENAAEAYRYRLHQLKATPFQADAKTDEHAQPAGDDADDGVEP